MPKETPPLKPLPTGIRIHLDKNIPPDQLNRLYAEANWGELPEASLRLLLRNSHAVCYATRDEQAIGFIRALSDGVSDAYILDLFVTESCRGQGIATAMLHRLMQQLHADNIGWFSALAAPRGLPVFQKLGFFPLHHHVPVRAVVETLTKR